jgi:hypothetical protein
MTFTVPQAIRFAVATLLLSLATPAMHAQDWARARLEASPRHHEYVPLKHGNRTVEAFVVYPEVKIKVPVVVLIHEIYGLSATVPATTAAMKAAGKTYEPVSHEGAGHGLMRAGEDPSNTVAGNKTAHEQGFARLVKLLSAM